MGNLYRDTEIECGRKFYNDTWQLNVYTIRSNSSEIINDETKRRLIEKHIQLLEKDCFSDEFDYYRTGFVFLHFGNRGVDLTIWHIGRWGNTFETYICSWYCYGRDIWNLEQLNSAEPMLCQYEMKLLIKEIENITELVNCTSKAEIRLKYFQISKERLCHSKVW